MKYKMIGEKNELGLRRIKALKDFGNVEAGDIGGWVASEENLSQEGDCWVFNDAEVFGNARVFGNAQVYGDAIVYGNAWVFGNARVYENAFVYGNARVCENAFVCGNAQVYENALVSGNARVFEYAFVYGNARVYENAFVYGNARVSGDAWVFEYAWVFGNARVYENAFVYGNAHIRESWCIKYGKCANTPSIIELLHLSIGVGACNNIVRLFKRVNKNLSSEHDPNFFYPESGIVECPDFDPDPTTSCSAGLHFSHVNYGAWGINDRYLYLVADIHLDDIICVQEGKVRCKKATIVGILQ